VGKGEIHQQQVDGFDGGPDLGSEFFSSFGLASVPKYAYNIGSKPAGPLPQGMPSLGGSSFCAGDWS